MNKFIRPNLVTVRAARHAAESVARHRVGRGRVGVDLGDHDAVELSIELRFDTPHDLVVSHLHPQTRPLNPSITDYLGHHSPYLCCVSYEVWVVGRVV